MIAALSFGLALAYFSRLITRTSTVAFSSPADGKVARRLVEGVAPSCTGAVTSVAILVAGLSRSPHPSTISAIIRSKWRQENKQNDWRSQCVRQEGPQAGLARVDPARSCVNVRAQEAEPVGVGLSSDRQLRELGEAVVKAGASS